MDMSNNNQTIKIFLLIIGLIFFNYYIALQTAICYDKPWDQGHDSPPSPNPPSPTPTPNPPPNNPCKGTGSPVYVKAGNLLKSFIDITFQACGKPIKITRVYNSFDEHSGLFGYGWTLSYDVRLIETASINGEEYIIVLMPNGQRYKFIKKGDNYTSSPGTFFTIKKYDDYFIMEDNLNLIYTFGEDGYITSIKDKNNNTVSLTYRNFNGCIDTISDGNTGTLIFTIGTNGKIASISGPDGNSFYYYYDDDGNLVKVIDTDGGETKYSYIKHRLTKIVNANDEVVFTATYEDNEPYRVKSYSERGEVYNITYNDSFTTKQNSLNQTTRYDFLQNGLISKTTTPLSKLIKHEYDENENYSKFIDQNNHQISFKYDSGNLTEIQDALNKRYKFSYYKEGDVKEITDPLNLKSTFFYDDHSNLEKIQRPDEEINVSYDEKGYIKNISSKNGILNFERDERCNLTKLSSTGSEVNIEYDIMGNPLAITRTNTLTLMSYNKINQLSSVNINGENYKLMYDKSGRLDSVEYPNENIILYSYNKNSGLLEKITFPNGNYFEYEFYSFGKLKSLKDKKNQTKLYDYDADHRLTKITFNTGATIEYFYDEAKNVKKIEDSELGTIKIEYDKINRVTGIISNGKNYTFSYNDIGKRIEKINSENSIITYDYDDLYRLEKLNFPDGTVKTYSPPIKNMTSSISLSDIIGLYNSQQNIRLLSYLSLYSPEEIVSTPYIFQFLKLQFGISESMLSGFSPYVAPYQDTISVRQTSSFIDFKNQYKRLGFGL